MASYLLNNFVGLLLGIAGSLLAWWILFHCIVPKIQFSDSLSKLPTTDENCGWKYRFKIQNIGKRDLLDTQILARLSILGLQFPNSWSVVKIPLDWTALRDEIPRISKRQNRVCRIFFNRARELQDSAIFPEDIRAKAADNSLLLEELLALGSKASVRIYVFGYDEFSGSRKLFVSKPYRITDIKEGSYSGLEITPELSPKEDVNSDAG